MKKQVKKSRESFYAVVTLVLLSFMSIANLYRLYKEAMSPKPSIIDEIQLGIPPILTLVSWLFYIKHLKQERKKHEN